MKFLLAAALSVLIAPAAHAAPKARRTRAAKKAPAAAVPPAPVALLHPPRVSTEPITFVWPPEGMTLAADNEFVFGSVADAAARFTINGATVIPHKDGGFIAWLPISAGTFTFRAELTLSSGVATAERHIFVPPAQLPLPGDKLAVDPASLTPRTDLELRAGDWWVVRMKATRGKPARARVGDGPWKAMREVNPRLGIYEAVMEAAPGEKIGPAPVEYELGSGWSTLRVKGTARVTAPARATLIATVKTGSAGFANIKTEPNQGFMLFPPAGVRMPVSGRDGDSIRVDLGPSLSGWIDAKDVDLAEAPLPRAETGNVAVIETPAGASLKITLSERVPFEVVENDALDGVTVRVFSSVGHTNIVSYDGGSDFVDFVRWRQEETGVTAFTVRLKPGRKLWGWNARYDGGSSLRLDIRRPPRVNPRRPLEGLKVMLDPGHMPSAPGATGPLGTKEMDANYAIAEAVAERLRREGAYPLLTRGTTTDEVSLTDRPKQAVERGADVFVSLHNNALPDGSNPFAKPRGFTIFYYHTHSLALARAVHAAYAARVPAADEGLQWDNLLVARLSAVPAILVENAFIILPEQEAQLNDPAFRAKLADSVVQGLRDFALAAGERKP
ncbi:MAG: N-acetylmuramoyl-L-alanine amidase [Elusimicrobiota bacterium]